MRILHLTAGTGSFYCGTCLRDAALVKALRALGHDALMAPLYLPLALEEPLASEPVRLGGISVYLRHTLRALPLPRFALDWLDSPRVLAFAAARAEMTDAASHGALTVSILAGEDGRVAREVARLIAQLAELPRPDAVLLSNALLIGLARPLKRAFGAPILCTLQGEAPFLDALAEPHRGEAWRTLAAGAREVDAFLAVSRYTANLMTERAALDPARVHVVRNGIDLDGLQGAPRPDGPPAIGYLARLCRDKGLPLLVEAWLELRRRPEHAGLRLIAVGAALRGDFALVDELRQKVRAAGAGDAAEFHPNVERSAKLAHLARCAVFSVPATYGESFGLYLLEALASGVPVVQPRHGAFPEILAATGGGILVEPDDPRALADGLASLLLDPRRARTLGLAGRIAVEREFTSERMARDVERACRAVTLRPLGAAIASP